MDTLTKLLGIVMIGLLIFLLVVAVINMGHPRGSLDDLDADEIKRRVAG